MPPGVLRAGPWVSWRCVEMPRVQRRARERSARATPAMGVQPPQGNEEVIALIHQMSADAEARAREGLVHVSQHLDESQRLILAHVSENRVADLERSEALHVEADRRVAALEAGLTRTISLMSGGNGPITLAAGSADPRAGRAPFSTAMPREHASTMAPRPSRGRLTGGGETDAGPATDAAPQRNLHAQTKNSKNSRNGTPMVSWSHPVPRQRSRLSWALYSSIDGSYHVLAYWQHRWWK